MPSSDFDDSTLLTEEEAQQLGPTYTTAAGEISPISQRASDLMEIKNEIRKLRRDDSPMKIKYEPHSIFVDDSVEIKLDPYSKEALLCKVVFSKSSSKIWEIEDIKSHWSDRKKDYKNRAVTDAARRVNDKAASLLRDKLFITRAKTLKINPKFIIE